MRINTISEKRQKLLDDFNNEPIKVGDTILTVNNSLHKVLQVGENGTDILIKKDTWLTKDEYRKDTSHVGANPFVEIDWHNDIISYQFDVAGILDNVFGDYLGVFDDDFYEIPELNWNPYITDSDGNRKYYQRDFVWTLNDKQLLIESIYKYIDCGKIVLRERKIKEVEDNWKNGDKSMCWYDVVDGKQRLKALEEFVTDKFPDYDGNYFSDLSRWAQMQFLRSKVFTYCQLGNNSTDETTIRTFLMVNHTGKPMDREHIEHVNKIYEKI